MTKTICDVCGKEMQTTKKFGHSIRDLNLCVLSHDKMWDICDSCHEELYKFITIYKQKEMCEKEIMVEKTENEEETNEMITIEEVIEEIEQVKFNLNCRLNGTSRFEEAFEMAIKALKQIKKIKDIINGPECMQGDIFKYRDICEVLEEEEVEDE